VADVVGVVFPNGAKTYFFDPAGLELGRGDRVVVQTANGPEIGQVVEPSHTIEDSELPAPLKKVTRLATGKDLEAQAAAQNLRKEAMATCREMIASHGLDMKLVGADISFGGEKITFSFYADERVDFRTLVADLAKALKTRIELRQVGAREEARMVGGLGPCGRALCCTLFPPGDEPVSIRMAKEQNLPLNPAKISGLCGRLMCCLKYEQDQYVRFRKEAPAKGTPCSTPGGEGVVVGYNVLKDAINVRLEDGHTTEIKVCSCQCQADGGLLVLPEPGEETEGAEGFGVLGGTGASGRGSVGPETGARSATAGRGERAGQAQRGGAADRAGRAAAAGAAAGAGPGAWAATGAGAGPEDQGGLADPSDTAEYPEALRTIGDLAEPLTAAEAAAVAEAAAADAAEEELAVVEAEVVLGADGEPVEVIVAETSRRSRGRRGRGRRGGRGRGRAASAAGAAEVAGAGGGAAGGDVDGARSAPAGAAGAASDGGAGAAGPEAGTGPVGGRRHGQHPTRHPERHRGGGATGGGSHKTEAGGTTGGEAGAETGGSGSGSGAEAGAGTSSSSSTRSRRRRRSRRPGGGADAVGGAVSDGGADGGGAGESAGD
jgi:cell fate regulator YaaT (PSP1 superfamily)